MDEVFFVFEIREDKFLKKGVRVRRFTHSELEEYVNSRFEEGDANESTFAGPHSWPKWLEHWSDGETIIIRGTLIQPVPETEVVRYKIPYI